MDFYFGIDLLQQLRQYYEGRLSLALAKGFDQQDAKYHWLFKELECRVSTLRKLMSMISAGGPSAAAILASFPSPMKFTVLPFSRVYPMMLARVSFLETAAFSRSAISISTLKWPALASMALSFIASICSTVIVCMHPVAVTNISPSGAAFALFLFS